MALTTNFKLMFWLLIARLLPHFILTLEEDSVWDKCLFGIRKKSFISLSVPACHEFIYPFVHLDRFFTLCCFVTIATLNDECGAFKWLCITGC